MINWLLDNLFPLGMLTSLWAMIVFSFFTMRRQSLAEERIAKLEEMAVKIVTHETRYRGMD